MEITKHFTATTIIVYKKKTLLHFHKKLKFWLPVGGHIDRDELPEETALREVKEESGLDIKLYNPDKKIEIGDVKQLIRPIHILIENINQFHQHIDFIYYAKSNTFQVKSQDNETNNLKWFSVDKLKNLKNTPENVKILSLEAINLLDTN